MQPDLTSNRPAVVLLSGGLDSATVAALARHQGFHVIGLSIRYGQVHEAELAAARAVAKSLDLEPPVILDLPLAEIGGSALLGTSPVPDEPEAGAGSVGIPSTYVPARNLIFLSFAAAFAEVHECADIFIGVNALDYSGYPDCRPEFIRAFERALELGTRSGVDTAGIAIHTPLIRMTKSEIVAAGHELGLDYSLTVSCYRADSEGRACGRCDSCGLRRRGFEGAGLVDPTRYQSGVSH